MKRADLINELIVRTGALIVVHPKNTSYSSKAATQTQLAIDLKSMTQVRKKKIKMCLDFKLYLCNFLEKETKASMKGIAGVPLLLILKQRAGVQG